VIARIAIDVLLAIAVLVTVLSAIGLAVMRDVYQKLHFIAPPASIGAICVVAALLIGEKQKQAVGKAALIAFFLYFMNAVITHATARAHYVREKGTWPPKEKLEVVDQ
jgi:monovalent cation/proton antiporter MnhG/PhaG subunit